MHIPIIFSGTVRNPGECGAGNADLHGFLYKRYGHSFRANMFLHMGRKQSARILRGSGIYGHPLQDHCPRDTFCARPAQGMSLFIKGNAVRGVFRWFCPAVNIDQGVDIPVFQKFIDYRCPIPIRHWGQNNAGRSRGGKDRKCCRKKDVSHKEKNGRWLLCRPLKGWGRQGWSVHDPWKEGQQGKWNWEGHREPMRWGWFWREFCWRAVQKG